MRMLLALRDVRTGAFLSPLTCATPGEAERMYIEVLRSEGTLIGKHPADFPLYHIGTFDEFTGMVSPLLSADGRSEPPRLLLDAAQLNLFPKEGV